MPTLLNSGVGLKGTTGTNTYFITLSSAQPLLGQTPTTSTGYTLVTGADGQLHFTNTLGNIAFTNSNIQTTVPNGDLTIQSNGSGALNLNGNVFINGQTINAGTATFTNLTITNLVVPGYAIFTSATNTATFLSNLVSSNQFNAYGNVNLVSTGTSTVKINPVSTGSIDNMVIGYNTPQAGYFTNITTTGTLFAHTGTFTIVTVDTANISALNANTVTTNFLYVNTETIFLKFTATGQVDLSPNNGQNVVIEPTNNGTVYIYPSRSGYIDNVVIGSNAPQSGYFTNITAHSLTLDTPIDLSTASITSLTVSSLTVSSTASLYNLTVTGTSTVSNLTVLGASNLTSVSANTVTTNNFVSTSAVITHLTATDVSAKTISVNTITASLVTATDISAKTISVNTITASLVTATHIVSNSVLITDTTQSTTSTDGALIVAGGIGVGKNIVSDGDVYSDGGSPYYNRLLYTPNVIVSTMVPTNPRIGDFWIDPNVGVEFQYVPNGTGTIWVQFIGF